MGGVIWKYFEIEALGTLIRQQRCAPFPVCDAFYNLAIFKTCTIAALLHWVPSNRVEEDQLFIPFHHALRQGRRCRILAAARGKGLTGALEGLFAGADEVNLAILDQDAADPDSF